MRGAGTIATPGFVASGAKIRYTPRERRAIFRCEACGREIFDLRAVFLCHRGGAWRIECSTHDDGDYAVDAGRVFGGGLNALDFFAEVAGARWFNAGDLLRTFLRLRAQASGLYLTSRPDPATT
jgi:hypothetical protein